MRGGVAVLGAGGFVGARLLEMAALSGWTDVVPVVRAVRSVARNAHLGLPHRFADAGHRESLERALAGCDVAVNLTTGDPADILRTTATIHDACRAAGVRLLVHLSSAVVYGQVDRPDLPDDAPPQLDHWMLYARQKGLAENYLRARMADGRLTIVVLRPGLVWGPRSPWVLGPATELVRGTAWLVAGGHGVCNLVYVDNLIRGLDAVVTHPAPPAGFYHVADDETTTWRAYYAALAAGLGVDWAGGVHELPGDRFRPTLGDRLEVIQEWPAYKRLKSRLSDETRKAIKFQIARLLGRDGSAAAGLGGPVVTRELWHLQSTRHRLPTGKFRATFGYQNRTSFADAMATSVAWLRFIGLAVPERAASAAAGPVVAAAAHPAPVAIAEAVRMR
jgi:nucleoside-diphosphate-sugar epimerase